MNKLKSRQELVDYIKNNRENKTIVFTNGCFDILHIGHIKLLQFAKNSGDILVLGLNSDSSIKRIKGDKRPIVCQEDRAEVLSALECVDFISIFDEDTPCELISLLKPDVHVKGGDYDVNKIPEAKIIRSYGGKILRFEYIPNHSSTGIIEKILSAYK